MKRWVLAGALGAVALAASWAWVTRPHLPPAERGRRLAESAGCFACHGPEGTRGTANPGRPDGAVPTFGGELMMYANGREQVREWIRDGVSKARSNSRSWQEAKEKATLVMPAFASRLSEREIDDLVAFVTAVHGLVAPDDSLARRGLERAEELGCFGCHGAGGRFARPNPGSLKGYVPSWNGADFPDLVRDSTEFDEWVRSGICRRLNQNRIARFFLERAVLSMPSYEEQLDSRDLDALWAYVSWLRSEG